MNRRIWGWYFFDWASQPYNTLLLTFIFGPYFAQTAAAQFQAAGLAPQAARAEAQALWGYGLTITGLCIAFLAPVLGAVADVSRRRLPWIWGFSALYVIGSAGLWWSAPEDFSALRVLLFFGLGLAGMEFAIIFTNAYLPDLHPDASERGRISGSGWAFGYVGGVVSLALMLAFFQAGPDGRTMAGLAPLFGLSPETGADTRVVGPLTAAWFALFAIPFFAAFRDPPAPALARQGLVRDGLASLAGSLRRLPRKRSLLSFLGASMFYRDALNGLYTFGGIYALGVLGWSITLIGMFGIFAAISGAVFCWIGGRVDRRFGPKPLIVTCCGVLLATSAMVVTLTPTSVLGVAVDPGSSAPDIAFFGAGILIGAAGGALQASSRTMMTRQAAPGEMTTGFGLYALSGKATAFLAPALIAVTTDITGSQRLGIVPVAMLFLAGLVLMAAVHPKGDPDT